MAGPSFLFGTQAAGGSSLSFPTLVEGTYLMGAGVALRDPVIHSTVADTVERADASAVATGRSFGVVSAIDTPIVGSCTVILIGEVSGFAGLVPGSTYLLGIAPGAIVESTDTGNANYPDNVGNVIQPVGTARTASILQVNPDSTLNVV